MSIIKCSECGHDVSENATACPNCGNPLVTTRMFGDNKPLTIQKTLKKWKFMKLISWVFLVLGVISVLSNDEGIGLGIGITGIFLGIVGLITATLGAWWSNG